MRRRHLLAAAAALGLAGCGFQLRQPPQMPFQSIALIGFAPKSPLADELRTTLARQVKVLEAPAGADVVLQATEERRERSVVASTSAGQVREKQLRLRLNFRAQTPDGRQLIAPTELLLSHDMIFNETAALGKQQEEDELFRDMQSDVVQQVLRRLAAVKL